MSDTSLLEALQAIHRDLVAACENRLENIQALGVALEAHAEHFRNLLDKPPRAKTSRDAVQSGKISISGEEYSVNKDFQEMVLQLADELDLDEVESAKLLLDSEEDQITLGRSLLECGLIRFHQQRKYLLDCVRQCLKLADDDEDEELDTPVREWFDEFVTKNILRVPGPGEPAVAPDQRVVSKCMATMSDIRSWLQRLTDQVTTASIVYQNNGARPPEEHETLEFSRLSLISQHEHLAVIVCAAIERHQAQATDFENFLKLIKGCDRYDCLLVHLFPIMGTYIRMFGSPEGAVDITQARALDKIVCSLSDTEAWQMPFLRALVNAWWIAEYSGYYIDDQFAIPENVDVDEEDKTRSKRFTDSLKEGAFDFMLSVAMDVKAPEWQDPVRLGVQQWLRRKSPHIAAETASFSAFFQIRFMEQLEFFIEAFISNLPDVLRKLRVEEDEQRQLSQAHEQDLDLERFLLIIAHAYEGRPGAASNFWSDPDSNLAGFMQWASRRASTPLVSAFCEMLQAISETETSATAAHLFLLDEGQLSSGKLRRSQSLTWTQILKELDFFTNKIRDRASAPQASHAYRAGKPSSEQAETEPESAMMLECYMRLISKLATNSTEARQWLLKYPDFSIVPLLFQLVSLPIPARLRACALLAIKSFMTKKSIVEGQIMWKCLEQFENGGYVVNPQIAHRSTTLNATSGSQRAIENISEELGYGFAQPNAFIQLLTSLMAPSDEQTPLNDCLPFPEEVGASARMPGVEPYVDFVLGNVFAKNSRDITDVKELRVLRLTCLEFALTCLETFNEDLILIGNDTNIAVDAVIAATDLATYVRLHPFARVMEWMYNDKVVESIFQTVHQDSMEIGMAAPDSPLILGIIRAVEVMLKVLELQDTYMDLVRQVIRQHGRRTPIKHSAYSSFEEGIMNHMDFIIDLGRCCGLGHPALTLASLKLLEKLSVSPKVISSWTSGLSRQPHRNRAIVALEQHGEADSIAGSFISELVTPFDLVREAESPNYMTKVYILDFLFSCLQASPNQPTIAHLILGFHCGINTLSVEPNSRFEDRTSLFHSLLRLFLEAPFGDDERGMRQWMIVLKYKSMRILQVLWTSSLSSQIVLSELRENDFLFHLLLREVTIQPGLPWDGESPEVDGPQFLLKDASMGFIDFLALRATTLEYIGIELCSVSQNRLPHLKRRISDALNGRFVGDSSEPMVTPTLFDLYDFLSSDAQWDISPPEFNFFRDLDLRSCWQEDSATGPMYNIDKARQILLLKRGEAGQSGQLLTKDQETEVDVEEATLLEYLVFSNRQKHLLSNRRKVLKSWTNLLLVMIESSELSGTAKVSFLLQALQVISPSLEEFGLENSEEAYDLAKLAKVLLFKLDLDSAVASEGNSHSVGNLVGDKVFQLFQICLYAIGKWAGNADLRSLYYVICYRYVSGIVGSGTGHGANRQKVIKVLQIYGEKLFNVICDDAYRSDPKCQTAAFILLSGFVHLSNQEDDSLVVDTLNRLNFIGILVDSLKSLLEEGLAIIQANSVEQAHYQDAKLALLLQLCQTRDGAKCVLHANLFRSIELSGLFSADPELQINPADTKALAQHYALLVKVARIIGAAIVSRGSHNVLQGRRFLTEHRMLVMHVLKRSAGIGAVAQALEERIEDLADAFMLLISATGFLDFEEQSTRSPQKGPVLFH